MTRLTLLLIPLLVLLSACGGNQEPTPVPVAAAPTDTPLPTATASPTNTAEPTATPTTVPLTASEEAYFDAIYTIRDKKEAAFYSFPLLAEVLDQLQPPSALAATHSRLLEVLGTLNTTFELFKLSALTYSLSWCDINSYDYYSCTLREEQALSDMRTYGAQFDSTKAQFQTLWQEAQVTWDEYRIAHGAESMPTATPFPLPPVATPIPVSTPGTGVFGTKVVVQKVDQDAWKAIEGENQFNDAPDVGNKYIMVTIFVANRSQETINVSPSDFSVYIDGEIFEESGQLNPDDFEGGNLAVSASASGNLSFEVPSRSTGAVLLYLKGDLVMALN